MNTSTLPLLPIPRGRKGPVLKNWQTLPPEELAKLIAQNPGCNIGIRHDNTAVLDPDSKEAGELCDRWEAEGELPKTVKWKTAAGNIKRLFRRPASLDGPLTIKSLKLQLRTGSGMQDLIPDSYVKDPGKEIDGHYKWVEGHDPESIEIAELHQETIDFFKANSDNGNNSGDKTKSTVTLSDSDLLPPETASADYQAYGQKALANELAILAGTTVGGRNEQLNKSAFALGQIVGAGVLDRGSVEAALYGVAMSIGLGTEEARATIRSGLASGMQKPRKLPKREPKRPDGASTKDRKWASQALQGVEQGKRKETAARLAEHFFALGESESLVSEMLVMWNTRNVPPLEDSEIQEIITKGRLRQCAIEGEDNQEEAADLPPEEARKARLQGLGKRLGLPIVDVKAVFGVEGFWELTIGENTVTLTGNEMCSQKNFHNKVFAATFLSAQPVFPEKNGAGGWRSVLQTFAKVAIKVDAGPESTLAGQVCDLVNGWIAAYRLSAFNRNQDIPAHVVFFVISDPEDNSPQLCARLDGIFLEAKNRGYSFTRGKLISVFRTLGHINKKFRWNGKEVRCWRLNLEVLSPDLRPEVYKIVMTARDG